MDISYLERFTQSKGLEISQILTTEYDSTDFEINSTAIEKEIYEISTSYSKVLFFEAKQFLQESVKDETRAHLASRFDSKQIMKMNDVDLIAHWIKSEVIRQLDNRGILLT